MANLRSISTQMRSDELKVYQVGTFPVLMDLLNPENYEQYSSITSSEALDLFCFVKLPCISETPATRTLVLLPYRPTSLWVKRPFFRPDKLTQFFVLRWNELCFTFISICELRRQHCVNVNWLLDVFNHFSNCFHLGHLSS